jgi:probable HAF family extracellular repeat protein
MTRFARRVCSIGCVALVLSAFALTLMVIPSGAFGLTFTTIDVPGAMGTLPTGINAAGQIVGGYTDASGTGHGFLATP